MPPRGVLLNPMTPEQQLIEDFLALNERAAGRREFEGAYHALMGALHVADHCGEIGMLERIADAARAQEREIESLQPPHPLSRSEAARRGHPSIYASALVHIEAVRLRLDSARQIAKKNAAGS